MVSTEATRGGAGESGEWDGIDLRAHRLLGPAAGQSALPSPVAGAGGQHGRRLVSDDCAVPPRTASHRGLWSGTERCRAGADLALFLMSPVAGVVADRFSRKAIMITADLVRAGLALGFLLITTAERVWLAYVLTAALMGVAAFFNPAHAATIPNITTRRELMAANALTSASWAAMLAIGAALGGLIAAVLGTGAAFVINAVGYVVSAWCISTVPIPASPTPEPSLAGQPRNGWQDFWHGLRYMYTRPNVLRLLSVKAWSAGVGGGLLILFALFAEGLFQAGAMGMGMLYMMSGLGAMVGPLLARRLVGETPQAMLRTMSIAFFISASFHVAFAYMP